MPAFATPGPIAATVVVGGAQVRVTASDRTDTVVLVEPIDQASQSDVKVASKTKVNFAGGQLSVKTTVSGDKNGSVAITIDLPAGSSLVAYLAHSDVHADGSFGECELHMASGRVQIDRIIRGCNPAPGAWTTIDGKTLKVFEAKPLPAKNPKGIGGKMGEVVEVGSDGFTVVCADGRMKVLRVQADGPKIAAGEYAGNAKLTSGKRFS